MSTQFRVHMELDAGQRPCVVVAVRTEQVLYLDPEGLTALRGVMAEAQAARLDGLSAPGAAPGSDWELLPDAVADRLLQRFSAIKPRPYRPM
ncbi:MAG: hypothetical protein QE280_11905 [Caulobacter sp.]|jgi:hypothetical protein|nr:hypothetical protein [Caulobacter sp.]